MSNVIDLKTNQQERQLSSPPVSSQSKETLNESSGAYEWTAREYEKKERTFGWFALVGVILSILVVIAALAGNYLFIAFLVLAAITAILFFQREPREIRCAIMREGVALSDQLYPFSRFASFWIFDGAGVRELSLENKKTLPSYMRIPLGDADAEEIKARLARSLPEKEHAELMTDHIARALGL